MCEGERARAKQDVINARPLSRCVHNFPFVCSCVASSLSACLRLCVRVCACVFALMDTVIILVFLCGLFVHCVCVCARVVLICWPFLFCQRVVRVCVYFALDN